MHACMHYIYRKNSFAELILHAWSLIKLNQSIYTAIFTVSNYGYKGSKGNLYFEGKPLKVPEPSNLCPSTSYIGII